MSTPHDDPTFTAPDAPREGFGLWAVWRRNPNAPAGDAASLVDVAATIDAGENTIRGFYDVSGLRADADLMVWLHGPTAEGLQRDLRALRRTPAIAPLLPTWNVLGVHRDAEFNRSHVPGFLRGVSAREWLCLYPFVRSYDWYVLPERERAEMLIEHGRKGAAFTSVVANTVATFGLSDYEWVLPLESDELTDLVDMMRDLRATQARLHVREEVPFFTGRRITAGEVSDVLA